MPELTSSNLAAKLKDAKNGNIPTLWYVTGNEPLLALEAEDMIRSAAKEAGYTDRKSFSFDGMSDYTPLIEALSDISLFGERQLVEVRLLKGNPGSRNGPKALSFALSKAGPDNLVMIQSPAVDRAQTQKEWYKELVRKALVVRADEIPAVQLPKWIKDRLARQNQIPDEEALNFIANRTEGNLLACEQEIRKLALLAPEGTLTLAQVRDAVSDVSRFDPEDLSIAILNGDAEKIARIVEGLKAESVPILNFLWSLVDDVRIASKLGAGVTSFMFGYSTATAEKQRAFHQFLKRVSPQKMELMLTRYANTDKLAKGLEVRGASEDPWLELKAAALLAVR